MGLVAAMLVQNALKHTLSFGQVSHYLGYNALSDFFPTWPMVPNPSCMDAWCTKRQKQYAGWKKTETLQEAKTTPVQHIANEWGISCVESSVETEADSRKLVETAGVRFEYEASGTQPVVADHNVPEADVLSLISDLQERQDISDVLKSKGKQKAKHVSHENPKAKTEKANVQGVGVQEIETPSETMTLGKAQIKKTTKPTATNADIKENSVQTAEPKGGHSEDSSRISEKNPQKQVPEQLLPTSDAQLEEDDSTLGKKKPRRSRRAD